MSILKYNDYPFLSTLIKDDLSLFSLNELKMLEDKIISKTNNKTAKQTYWVNCIIREKEIQLKPEEIVRQLYAQKLISQYGYDKSQIQFEYTVNFGREKKSADIVIFQKNKTEPYIIVELKKAKLKDGKEQLKSYVNATGAPMAVWTNGQQISYYHRKDPNYFEAITDIPKAGETLDELLNANVYLSDLEKINILVAQRKSLREVIEELEDEVLANAGVDSFEEVFKLIFIKLYDEQLSARHDQQLKDNKLPATGKKRPLEFRKGISKKLSDDELDKAFKERLSKLFQSAKEKWHGVFSASDKIELIPSHLSICASHLQDVMLFNSNLEVVDEAFEYLINKSSKGEKGQYFTPRYVIDMCVKMINPQEHESVIDTAAGSCGFPVHAMLHVWNKIYKRLGLTETHLMTAVEKPEPCKQYVREKVFALDFDKRVVRVARTLNLIAGDGETNVIHLNCLDYGRWRENEDDKAWKGQYGKALERLRDYRPTYKNEYGENIAEDSDKNFNFDILLANPPFAGDIQDKRILENYELSQKFKIKKNKDGSEQKEHIGYQTKVGRDILFIERNINFLKPGGRMAIVLPQGRFNNSSDTHIRNFLAERGRILAVVGLHGNVFKPHTGTKTSVLLWQKWTDKNGINPKLDDYPIFFATMQKPSKDNSGDKIYIEIETQNGDKERELDNHKHLIVDHDLFNHDGLTQDGIFEAFREFAKREQLSFFFGGIASFNEKRYAELLESLEVSEVKLSEMFDDGRMDAEYYKKEYLIENLLIKKYPIKKLGELAFITDGQHGYYEMDDNSEIRFLIGKDFHNWFAEDLSKNRLAKWVDDKNQRSALKENDLVFTTIGTIGYCSLIKNNVLPANISQNVARVHITESNLIQPHFLLSYTKSKLGQDWIKRNHMGAIQQKISLDLLRSMPIPILSINIQNKIAELLNEAYLIEQNSKSLYSEAENLLLQELDLENYKEDTQNIAEVSLSQMLQTGRMDAEYFQPKYAKFVEHLKNYKNGCEALGKLVNLRKSVEVGADEYLNENEINSESVPFVRVSNISPFELTTEKFISEKTYIEINTEPDGTFSEKHQPQQGEILLTKDATLGIAYHLAEKPQKMIVSGGILRLTNKTHQLNNESLTLILNSKIVKEQINRDAGGSIIAHWRPDQIQATLIPLIPQTLQNQIAEKVQKSHKLKSISKRLLEVAKKAVEIAIEQNEQIAMNWIEQET